MRWIAVLTRTQVRIFEDPSLKDKSPALIKEFKSELPRQRNRAFFRDSPGTDASWVGRGKQLHSMTREKDPHEQAAVEFMKSTINWMNTSATEKNITDLIIVSDSHLYGIIKPLLSSKLRIHLQHISKNLGKVKIIPNQLHEVIGL
jgi:hypothetical protein